MRIIFFGTPDFAANILKKLIDYSWDVVAVVSRPDKPKGRSGQLQPTPVKEVVQSLDSSIPVYQPEKVSDPEFIKILESYKADVFVVVAYGEIVKQNILDLPPKGCINIHASLLPAYRGAAPIQRALINGEKKTGITIMYMARKMDAGDMIEAKKVPIPPDMTYGELEKELCKVGEELILDVLAQLEKGKVKGIPQDHNQATFAPKIELEDCQIFWQETAENIHNLVRGVNPEPGAWCFVKVKGEPKRLKIYKTKIETTLSGSPGSILPRQKNELIVACGSDAVSLLEVQLEGKKRMAASDLLRGLSLDQLSFFNPV